MKPIPRRSPAEVACAFLTPRRFERPPFMEGARSVVAEGPLGKVACRLLGEGPCVLLLHGWEGSPGDFSAFVPGLLAAGFSVLAMDLPAHGESAGEWMSVPLAARALCDVQAASGLAFGGAVAHSLGASVLVHAMTLGLQVGRVALIAAPDNALDYARDYCEREGFDAALTDEVLDIMLSEYGVDVRSISMPAQAAHLAQPALLIHSDDDRVVPLAGSLKTSRAWAGARHVTVQGLGHSRLLRDATVAGEVLGFLAVS